MISIIFGQQRNRRYSLLYYIEWHLDLMLIARATVFVCASYIIDMLMVNHIHQLFFFFNLVRSKNFLSYCLLDSRTTVVCVD